MRENTPERGHTKTYLEHMKSLKLNIPTFVSQHIHHQFQVIRVRNVLGHDIEVCPVKKKLAKEFKGLALRHVVVGVEKGRVAREEVVEAFLEELGNHSFVFCEEVLDIEAKNQ